MKTNGYKLRTPQVVVYALRFVFIVFFFVGMALAVSAGPSRGSAGEPEISGLAIADLGISALSLVATAVLIVVQIIMHIRQRN